MSSFICAIRYRDHIPVFLLVERGEDWHDDGRHNLNVEYSSHRLEGNEDIVRLLAKKGITLDLGVDDGELMYISVLSKCEGDRHSPVLKLLDEFGATYNPEKITSYTPLMLAVIKGDGVDVWKELQRSSDVNEKNQRGRNAIIYAALARHVAGVEALLEVNADVHSKDEDGMTALCAACKGGNKRIVKLLLKSGADVSAQDRCGRTAISIATESRHARILPLLQGHGTDSDWDDELSKDEAEFRRFFPASGPSAIPASRETSPRE